MEDIAQTVQELCKAWHKETCFLSNLDKAFRNENYQHLIELGPKAVPALLVELRDQPDWYFEALSKMTGKRKGKEGDNFREVRAAWLDWGVRKGHIDSFSDGEVGLDDVVKCLREIPRFNPNPMFPGAMNAVPNGEWVRFETMISAIEEISAS